MDWNNLTLNLALHQTAKQYPDRIAIVDGDTRISYRDLDEWVDCLAHGFMESGVRQGDQVAIWMTNCAQWVACWIATAKIGAVLVTINTRYKRDEVEYILKQSDASTLILMDHFWNIDFYEILKSIVPEIDQAQYSVVSSSSLPSLKRVFLWDPGEKPGLLNLNKVSDSGRKRRETHPTIPESNPKDPIIIVYTSGTTGHPKGAMHSHIILRQAANVARWMHAEQGDVVLGHMPFYHVAGAFTELALSVLLGCTLVTLPHWIPDEAMEVIEKERVSIFGGIPTHFVDCIDSLTKHPRDTSCLKSAWIGGAPVTPDVAIAAKNVMKLKALQAVYGMTETTACTTLSEFDAPLEVLCDNKGKPVGDFEVEVRDASTGNKLPIGETGEVWVRGHVVMQGYYKNPSATQEVMTQDGWFKTGDLGVYDDQGYLKITGRLKDMFIVGGSNAYPAEIERILQSHPAIKQAVVVGAPHKRLGEVAMAFIQLHEGSQASEADIRTFCRDSMADFKVPRHISIVEDFPRTSTGKIQRFVLKKHAEETSQFT